MKKVVIAGIDPGFDGGIAILKQNNSPVPLILYRTVMPIIKSGNRRSLDVGRIVEIFEKLKPDSIFIEKVQPMPKQGIVSTGNYMYNAGILEGITIGMKLPCELVRPQQWKKIILKGTKKDKNAAIEKVRRMYPKLNLKKSKRSKKPHDGIADAILIALYGFSCIL